MKNINKRFGTNSQGWLWMSLSFLLLLGAQACTDPDLPPNPFDDVNYNGTGDSIPEPDSSSIVGIHQNILMVYCNNPGCHDGSFEPDFRTVQSAYTTLVYHPVVKNDPQESYTYRAFPGDESQSMLIRRITQGDAQLQKMPATGVNLSDAQIGHITKWIEDGCKDMFGNFPTLPNNEPLYMGYVAYEGLTRIDTARVDDVFYFPFEADPNTTVTLYLLLSDDETPVPQLSNVAVKFSTDYNDFSGATSFPMSFQNIIGQDLWVYNVNTTTYGSDVTVYFRFYFNDGDHAQDTEFPTDETEVGYKTYQGIYIKP